MTIQPTKDRLPGFLSYPLGWQAMESALGTLPQWEQMHLIFRAHPSTGAQEFYRRVRAGMPHLVMTAEYVRFEKRPSIGNDPAPSMQEFLRGHWALRLYPVSRDIRAQARRALITDGLSAIAAWLVEQRPESWYWGRRRRNIVFVPADASLRINDGAGAG